MVVISNGKMTHGDLSHPNMKDYDSEDERLVEAVYQEALRRSRIPVPISDALVEFFGTGQKEMVERNVLIGILGYVKCRNLMGGWDNGTIICDKKLKKLFNVDCFNVSDIPRLVIPHFLKRALDD